MPEQNTLYKYGIYPWSARYTIQIERICTPTVRSKGFVRIAAELRSYSYIVKAPAAAAIMNNMFSYTHGKQCDRYVRNNSGKKRYNFSLHCRL